MEPQDASPDSERNKDVPARTPEEFIRRYLAALETLQEKQRQDVIARRLAKLPEWIRRNR